MSIFPTVSLISSVRGTSIFFEYILNIFFAFTNSNILIFLNCNKRKNIFMKYI